MIPSIHSVARGRDAQVQQCDDSSILLSYKLARLGKFRWQRTFHLDRPGRSSGIVIEASRIVTSKDCQSESWRRNTKLDVMEETDQPVCCCSLFGRQVQEAKKARRSVGSLEEKIDCDRHQSMSS